MTDGLAEETVPPVSVVVPVFNEEEGLGEVLEGLECFRSDWPSDVEIIVVDDGSTDRTAEIADSSEARVLRNPANQGYGASLARGVRMASHEVVATIDGDGSYDPSDVRQLAEQLCKGFDMVIGARSGSPYNSSILKRIGRTIFHAMGEFVVGIKIPDINSGLRVFRRSIVVDLLPHLSKGFSFSTSLTIILPLRGHSVAFHPVRYGHRKGKSKVRTLRGALQATQILVETITFYNPIKLFLLIHAGLWLLALGCGIGYLMTGDLLLALGTISLFSGGILAFMLGLLALGNLRR